MMKWTLALVMFCSSWAGAVNRVQPDLKGWAQAHKKDDLAFYSKRIENSALLAFKAVGTVNINMAEMMAVLRDVKTTHLWDKNTAIKETVVNISDIEAITYSVTKVPWPFYNRDLVLKNKLYLDPKEKLFYVESSSTTHPSKPTYDDFVRAHMAFARFKIYPIDREKTHVDFEVHVDPKGSIPAWMVNLVQKDIPHDFLKGLEKYCKKVERRPNPGIKKMINEYFALTGKRLW